MNFRSLTDSTTSREKFHLLQGGPHITSLGGNLALRVYADTRPHNLETARLQKGLVLTFNGKELVEEGVGFGVPAAIFSDKTYFSGSAQVLISEEGQKRTIVKRFAMDTVSRKVFRGRVYVDDFRPYKLFSRSLAGAYRDYPAFRGVILPLIKLRSRVGVRTSFMKTEPRGVVTVTYRIRRDGVDVKADLTGIRKRCCEKVLLLNEQGSTFFRRFLDSDGSSLTDEKIGAWDLVKADWACLSDLDNTLSFRLERLPNCRLFRGREHMRGRLAWAGMGYDLGTHLSSFEYTVKICVEEAGNGRSDPDLPLL